MAARKASLLLRPGFFRARFLRGAQALQDAPRGLGVLIEPERLVVGHGLSPVGHGERGIDALGFLEFEDGLLVREVVQRRHAPEK